MGICDVLESLQPPRITQPGKIDYFYTEMGPVRPVGGPRHWRGTIAFHRLQRSTFYYILFWLLHCWSLVCLAVASVGRVGCFVPMTPARRATGPCRSRPGLPTPAAPIFTTASPNFPNLIWPHCAVGTFPGQFQTARDELFQGVTVELGCRIMLVCCETTPPN